MKDTKVVVLTRNKLNGGRKESDEGFLPSGPVTGDGHCVLYIPCTGVTTCTGTVE